MAEELVYDDSPERRDEPLDRGELTVLAGAGAQLAGRPAHVRHLIARMTATVDRATEERERLRGELARARESGSRMSGTEQILAALAALEPAEQEKVLGAHLAREAARLEEARQDAEMEVVAGRNLLARIVASAEELAEKEGAHARDLMRRMLQGAGVALR